MCFSDSNVNLLILLILRKSTDFPRPPTTSEQQLLYLTEENLPFVYDVMIPSSHYDSIITLLEQENLNSLRVFIVI